MNDQDLDDATQTQLLAARDAIAAFGHWTKQLSNEEFAKAARFTARRFEELAQQYEAMGQA